MTTKDTNSEMLEIFEFKYAMTEKINHNIKVISQVANAIKKERSLVKRSSLKKLHAKYRAALAVQIKARGKLSMTRVANQLGVKKCHVITSMRHFTERKNKKPNLEYVL